MRIKVFFDNRQHTIQNDKQYEQEDDVVNQVVRRSNRTKRIHL